MKLQYNTVRQHIVLREYGRNVQTMIENLLQVEDKSRRTEQAKGVVEILKTFIQPGLKDNIDINHKVWDDIFIMSNFKLDVDSPFPKPDASVLSKKPEKLAYGTRTPYFKHYGKNVELLADQIMAMTNEEEKEQATIYLGRLMKNFYLQYSKDIVEDYVIKDQLERLTKGKLTFDIEKVKENNLLDLSSKDRRPAAPQNGEFIEKRSNNNPRFNNNRNRNNSNNRNNNNNRRKPI